MADAITELFRLRSRVQSSALSGHASRWVAREINDRIAELEAAQAAEPVIPQPLADAAAQGRAQEFADYMNLPRRECRVKADDPIGDREAEPTDAEVEAWRESLRECRCMECGDHDLFYILSEQVGHAVALMRRGRGDARLRKAATMMANILGAVLARMDARNEPFKQSPEDAEDERKVRAALTELRAALGGAS